ncbi:MAG: class III signal peptide-containing protein [Methanobacterium sp.]|nr:class III signal peptide-containing protein [Methanobacterium sp.]
MDIIKEETGQSSAELMLLFGGIIVITIIAALFYKNYLSGLGNEVTNTDLQNVNNSINNLSNKFT